MASSVVAAPELPGNDRNRATDCDPPPPPHAVYVDQLYRQPEQFHVMLSNASQPSIVQPKSSKITFETDLSFNGVNLGIEAMKKDFDGGSITFGVKISARMKYRHGKWRNRTQYMRAYCVDISHVFFLKRSTA